MTRQFRKLATAVLVFFAVSLASALAHAQAPTIASITGYSDGVGVSNGRWNGQPSNAPPRASNIYRNFLASDSYNYGNVSSNPYYWDINGTNFGAAQGTIAISPNPFTSVTIVSWAATKIRVKVVATHSYTSSAFSLTVKTATGSTSAAFNDNAVGIIKSRGCGQCTWRVAKTRLDQGLSIPATAYTTTASIPAVGALDSGYQPAKWDCLVYSTNHVAIITSAPAGMSNIDGSITWTFTVSENNATWNESLSTSTRTYKLSKPNTSGKRSVLIGIGTNASTNWIATGYYR